MAQRRLSEIADFKNIGRDQETELIPFIGIAQVSGMENRVEFRLHIVHRMRAIC
jgi:hypothetical protein